MATAQIAALSPKGQIVLPKSIRTRLNLSTGTRFVIFADGDNILLKPVKLPGKSEVKHLLDEAQNWAHAIGMTEQDIGDAIAAVRSARR